jgi:hypothetical protein
MRDVLILLIHLIVTVVRLARPGGIPSLRSFSGRKTSRGSELRSFGSNIRRSTKVEPGFRYAGQCVLLMVPTWSYMVSPPDAAAAFPSARSCCVGAIGQIEVHGVASRITFEVVEDQARSFQHVWSAIIVSAPIHALTR